MGWTAWRRGAWATTLASGIEARADARRALSYVALAEAPHGVQLAVGVHDARLRAGVSASRGAWTWGYAYTDAPDGAAHGINLQLRFGLQTRTRRARERSERELEFASRFASMTEERDAAQLLQWRREAQQAFARGQFARAAALYQVVLETRPGDVRAADGLLQSRHASMVREADSLLQERDPAGALRALEKAIALAPYDSVSVQRLSQLRLAARDASRTRSAVSRHFNAGIEAYARQNYRDAVTEFDAVLKLDPQHAQATSYREQAMNSHDMRVRSALNQARTRLDADDFAGARSHLRRALDLEPGHSEARRLTARIEGAAKAAQREAERRTQEAEVAVVQPEDGAPVVPVAEVRKRYDSGMQEYRSGNLMTAMQTWEEVAELAPHFEEVDKYLLRIYRVTGLESYTEGRLRDAVDIWEKALLLEPENAQLRRYLNRAHAKLARAQSVDSGR